MTARRGEHVILLHGLGRSRRSMRPVARCLARAGYGVHNVDYPSTRLPIEALAVGPVADAVRVVRRRAAVRALHFVTHSMGGLLVRHYLRDAEVPELGRVVMLSPPNGGSEVADAVMPLALYRMVYGPAALQLGTHPEALPTRLGPVRFPLGILTGTRCLDPLGALLLPGRHDGRVAVARARVEGMHDFLALPCTHPFIMRDPEALDQTLHFLVHGRFQR